jgi:hypothetical protein
MFPVLQKIGSQHKLTWAQRLGNSKELKGLAEEIETRPQLFNVGRINSYLVEYL